jgi:hypothetical protein
MSVSKQKPTSRLSQHIEAQQKPQQTLNLVKSFLNKRLDRRSWAIDYSCSVQPMNVAELLTGVYIPTNSLHASDSHAHWRGCINPPSWSRINCAIDISHRTIPWSFLVITHSTIASKQHLQQLNSWILHAPWRTNDYNVFTYMPVLRAPEVVMLDLKNWLSYWLRINKVHDVILSHFIFLRYKPFQNVVLKLCNFVPQNRILSSDFPNLSTWSPITTKLLLRYFAMKHRRSKCAIILYTTFVPFCTGNRNFLPFPWLC